ncbi:SH3 domain-containing protein [Leptospira perdikensis]|uniref:SH3 domain-containing protein n=1 Tax=Leptospira perdikensis TaxID=2484948 RepID=A0A4R9JEM8_9LEPT|nr:SH3 domain-containing protein [Leptospira perdikensis]TGL39006.1 SH3 domain-containing protein [Leptospira perdikensis]
MKDFKRKNLFKKVGIFLLSLFLLNGSDLLKNEPIICPKSYNCLTTYISPGTILLARELDLSVIWHSRPQHFDKIILLTDKSGKFIEIKIDKNVYYYKAIWNGREVLLSRFYLDTSKKLRTLSNKTVQLYDEPSPSAKTVMIIPKNIPLEVIENTHPLTQNSGYVKVNYNDKVGWVKRISLSDDEFDIRFHQMNLENLASPYTFYAKENDFKVELNIIGRGFVVSDCKIGGVECSASSRMGKSSFGMPEEAVYFDLSVNGGQSHVCEIRRVDFVGELQRLIQEDITEEELDPFINCSLNDGESEEEKSDELE